MDSQTKNKMKAKYYEMFDGRIDKEVIDMVLQTCDYQGKPIISVYFFYFSIIQVFNF